MNKPSFLHAIFVAVLLLLSPGLVAQTFRAQIAGTVTDETGGVVPGVEVRAVHLATSTAQTSISNDVGLYRLLNLQPGVYRIEAELTGFKRFVQEPVVLQVADSLSLNIRLQVGEIADVVTVTGESPLLEAETSSLGSVVSERAIRELPLNVRESIALVALTPGVITGGAFGAGGGTDVGRNWFQSDFNIGGGQMRGQEILLDGAPSTSSDRNFATYLPPVDSTQEFRVQANSFSAEFGRTSGGIINIVTKSGTNDFRGTAYWFHRNSALDANNFFANRAGFPKTAFRRHQMGANTGGPIIRDNTFFFVAYEGFRQAFPDTRISTVPTALQRQGDFSQTFTGDGRLIHIHDPQTLRRDEAGNWVRDPFPDNRIPQARWDPVAQAVLAFYPEPNLPGHPVTGAQNFIFGDQSITDRDRLDFRVDHNFGMASRFFTRVSYEDSDRRTPRNWDNPAAHLARIQKDKFWHAVVGNIHTFSPSLMGELRLSFTRGHPNQTSVSEGFDLRQLNFPDNYVQVAAPHFPFFNVSDMTALGNAVINNQPRNTYGLQANLNKLFDRHSLKVGVDFRILDFHAFQDTNPTGSFNFGRLFTQGPDPLQARVDAGHGLASFLLGTGTGGGLNHITGLSLRRTYYAFYVQDDWKLTPRLTLNLGLRYDLDIGERERYNRLTNIDLFARSPLSDQVDMELTGLLRYLGTGGWPENQLDTDKNNFGPRLGLAYQLRPNTVVRAGYGIFYIPIVMLGLGSIGFNSSTPWVASIDNLNPETLLRDPYPQGFNLPREDRDPLTNVGFGLSGYIRDERVGYTQQWSLSVQHQVGTDLLLDLAYWGNKGTKLQYSGWRENDLPNQYLELGASLNDRVPNPFFGVISTGALSGETVTRQQLLRPYPQYTAVNRDRVSAGSQIYHAFTLKTEKRLSEGLSLLGSYTFSKTISDTPGREGNFGQGGILNMENRRWERALTPFDVPHRLVVSHIYELPFGRGRGLGSSLHPMMEALVGGWTFSGIVTLQSGFPVSISRNSNNDGRSARLSDPTIDGWFDTSVFTPAPPFTFGNVGPALPDVRTHALKNVDFMLGKSFYFQERYRLQFRAEFFNAFNTPRFGAPVSSVTSASFGVVTSQANAPREIQFALKLYW